MADTNTSWTQTVAERYTPTLITRRMVIEARSGCGRLVLMRDGAYNDFAIQLDGALLPVTVSGLARAKRVAIAALGGDVSGLGIMCPPAERATNRLLATIAR